MQPYKQTHLGVRITVLPKILYIFYRWNLKNHIKVYQNQISQYKIQIINEPLFLFFVSGIHKYIWQRFGCPLKMSTQRRLASDLLRLQYVIIMFIKSDLDLLSIDDSIDVTLRHVFGRCFVSACFLNAKWLVVKVLG